jgi:phosphohistidine phosphatase
MPKRPVRKARAVRKRLGKRSRVAARPRASRTDTRRYHPQAGAVPYRIDGDGKIEVLMVTNTNGDWIVPKGTIDPGWTAPETAMNEALEEAGVTAGQLGRELGQYTYFKNGRWCKVRMFALRVRKVEDDWLESHARKRRWCGYKEAVRRAAFENLAQVIALLRDAI